MSFIETKNHPATVAALIMENLESPAIFAGSKAARITAEKNSVNRLPNKIVYARSR
jgi:hypothetical protein